MNSIRVGLFITAMLVTTAMLAQLSEADRAYIERKYYPATALLYSQTDEGQMKMRCTATAIPSDSSAPKGTVTFVTASHCGCNEDTDKETSKPEKTFFFITSDTAGNKEFMDAKPIGCGYRHEGDDFMLLSVKTDKEFPLIKLGSDPKMLEPVVNIGSPVGLGKQVFFGTVSSPILSRPVVIDDINWTDSVLLQMWGINGGSSGSAVVCLDQKAICAFIVGTIDKTNIVALPVSRLISMRKELAAGTYQYQVKAKH